MDDSVFWTRLWITAAIVVSVVAVSITWYNDRLNSMRFEAWQQCLANKGEPKDVGIVGSNELTFTCDIP